MSGYDFGNICRHCDKETTTPVECTVSGTIPPWLHGSYIYNGPGITKIGKQQYQHCFDSASIIQKVTLSPAGATYMSRFLRSETYKKNMAAGTITVGEFGTAPDIPQKGFFSKLRKMTDMENIMSDNAVVSVVQVAGKLYALGETPFMQELNLDTLDTNTRRSLYREVSLVTQSPHPVKDGAGNSYTVGQGVSLTGPKYNIVKFPADGSAPEVIGRLSPRWRMSPCYMHSLGISENYIVILEMPLAVSLSEIMSDVFNNMAFIDGMKWHEENVLIHVLDIRTKKFLKHKYTLNSLFLLHIANCYEDEDGSIVVDFPCYSNATMLHDMYIDNLRTRKAGSENKEFCDRFTTKLTRVVLPISASDTRTEIPVEGVLLSTKASFENPMVNPLYQRRKHRFIYGMGVCPDASDRGQMTKLDTVTGEVKMFLEDQLYIAEPVFVPRPDAKEEDDGIVVIFCVTSSSDTTGHLLVLDAATMTEQARVTYQPGTVVPMPMHGIFVPTAS